MPPADRDLQVQLTKVRRGDQPSGVMNMSGPGQHSADEPRCDFDSHLSNMAVTDQTRLEGLRGLGVNGQT